jgi:hypothetical protein
MKWLGMHTYVLLEAMLSFMYYIRVVLIDYYGLVLWCLTPLSTLFRLYRGCQFYHIELEI